MRGISKPRVLAVLFLMLFAILASATLLPSTKAATLYVGGAGPGNYTKIQTAINAAGPGDTVYVHNGTYHESLEISKPISLVGENREGTRVVAWSTAKSVVSVTGSSVTVSGFTITRDRGSYYEGIKASEAQNCHFIGNNASGSRVGISLYLSSNIEVSQNILWNNSWGIGSGYSTGNIIANNSIDSVHVGISLSSSVGDLIADNRIKSSGLAAIYSIMSEAEIMVGNEMLGAGLYFDIGNSDSRPWNSHTIDTSNTVNGKPVHYWAFVNGGTVPLGAGQVILTNCTNVTVKDQNVSNGNLGIILGFSSNITATGNIVNSNWMYGIYSFRSTKNRISNNTVSFNGRSAINLWESDSNIVTANTAVLNGSPGVAFYRSKGNTISGNIMQGGGITVSGEKIEEWNTHTIDTSNLINGKPVYYWKNLTGGKVPSGAGQVILANCTDVIVENQNVSRSTAGIIIGLSERITVVNTTSSSQGSYGAYVWNSPGTALSNNTVSGNSYGLYVRDSEGSIVSNNTVGSSEHGGIVLPGSPNSEVSGNTVTNSNGGGIHTDASTTVVDNTVSRTSLGIRAYSDSIVSNNTVSHNDYGIEVSGSAPQVTWNDVSFNEYGIYVSSSNALVAHNQVHDNSRGIFIGGSSNSILYNMVHSNSAEGILIETSLYNTIARNTISYNGLGLHSYFYCEGNEIYHNNFIDNTEQAFEDRGSNQWDNGYPSGGNYWSDYAGIDEKSGPDQNQPGSDGIGDSSYMIPYYDWDPVDPKDRYPLMEPFEVPPAPPSAPWDLQAMAGFMRIELRWQPPRFDGGSPITNYTIYRGYAPGAETFLVEVGNVTTYVDTGLEMGKTYYYRVAAKNAIDEGPKSNEANATVPVALRPPLEDVRVPWTNISLNWTGPQPPIPGRESQTPSQSPSWESDNLSLPPASGQQSSLVHKSVCLHCIFLSIEECTDSMFEAVFSGCCIN